MEARENEVLLNSTNPPVFLSEPNEELEARMTQLEETVKGLVEQQKLSKEDTTVLPRERNPQLQQRLYSVELFCDQLSSQIEKQEQYSRREILKLESRWNPPIPLSRKWSCSSNSKCGIGIRGQFHSKIRQCNWNWNCSKH